jgi:NTE family protein
MITRSLGSNETEVPDFLSLLMFEPHYTEVLMEVGERDVDARLDELKAFFGYEEPREEAAS